MGAVAKETVDQAKRVIKVAKSTKADSKIAKDAVNYSAAVVIYAGNELAWF